ncbi:hypothetical protein [Sphingomonas oligophenolica]|uniref:Uncharacterized protein n=1 Tax=Sphingomonas oligophenolica TaxID=301154 RepID=A0A502CS06_9SPHN|nr:hypothetical protein [Sphingomonas oligophenolica]TPG15310.1 hypothetical protein EAH84_00335 [Sphingomonas oligophenolica]
MADEPNEILAAVADAKAREAGAAHSGDRARKNRWPMRFIGVGIGSAAVAAAVLFANSGKKRG